MLADAPLAYVAGLALGLTLAAPPGPMNALIANQAVRHGARSAIRIGLAAPIVDTLYMLLVVFGLLQVLDPAPIAPFMAAVGAAVMLYFALGTARQAGDAKPKDAPARFWTMFGLSATNPYQLLWWASAGAVLLRDQGLPGAFGFMSAIFGWVFAFSWLMAHGAKRWDWFTPLTAVVSADALLAFALRLALDAAAGVPAAL